MGGQHQGVFGIPDCPGNVTLCEIMRRMLDLGAYLPVVQEHSVCIFYVLEYIKLIIIIGTSSILA